MKKIKIKILVEIYLTKKKYLKSRLKFSTRYFHFLSHTQENLSDQEKLSYINKNILEKILIKTP